MRSWSPVLTQPMPSETESTPAPITRPRTLRTMTTVKSLYSEAETQEFAGQCDGRSGGCRCGGRAGSASGHGPLFKNGSHRASTCWAVAVASAQGVACRRQNEVQSSVPVFVPALAVVAASSDLAGSAGGLALNAGRVTFLARSGPRRSPVEALATAGAAM